MSSMSSSEYVSNSTGSSTGSYSSDSDSESESDNGMDHLPSIKPITQEKQKTTKAIAVKKATVAKGKTEKTQGVPTIKKPVAIRKTNAAGQPTHPSTIAMVNDAINQLQDRKGSSLKAIVKKITETYPSIDGEKIYPHVKKAIKAGVEKENLLQVKGSGASGSFKVNPQFKTVKKPLAEKKADGVKPVKKVVKKVASGDISKTAKKAMETKKKSPLKKATKVTKSPTIKPLAKPGRVPKVDKTPKNVAKPKAALKLPPSAMKSSPVLKKTFSATTKTTRTKKTTAKPETAKKAPVKKATNAT